MGFEVVIWFLRSQEVVVLELVTARLVGVMLGLMRRCIGPARPWAFLTVSRWMTGYYVTFRQAWPISGMIWTRWRHVCLVWVPSLTVFTVTTGKCRLRSTSTTNGMLIVRVIWWPACTLVMKDGTGHRMCTSLTSQKLKSNRAWLLRTLSNSTLAAPPSLPMIPHSTSPQWMMTTFRGEIPIIRWTIPFIILENNFMGL